LSISPQAALLASDSANKKIPTIVRKNMIDRFDKDF
jgi:hypothetical protein